MLGLGGVSRARWCLAVGLLPWAVGCSEPEKKPWEEKSLDEVPGEALVVFDLGNGAPESARADGWVPTPAERTYAGLLRSIEAVRDNAKVKGLFVQLGTSKYSWAQTEELGRAFGAFRSSGRPVVCHADSLGNTGVWLAAAACDHVWLSPAADVDSVGIAGESIYLKGILERLKVRADFLHVGKYKSASEMFTEDHPSEASIESMRFVLASIRDSWLAGIGQARKDPHAKEAAEGGPWDAESARAIGLVDAVGYQSDARKQLQDLTGRSSKDFASAYGLRGGKRGASRIAELLRAIAGSTPKESGPHVAIVPAIGGIAMEGGGGMSDDGIAADALTRSLHHLREDPSVKAVVLRIDSPGGSALASDLLWHELMLLREKKPLVVSVGSMAASGGYYLACAGNRVFAEQTSIVGSIGVLGGKFAFGDALAEYGVNTHLFTAQDDDKARSRASYFSPFQPWDDATKERIQHQMEQVYQLFLKRVAEGRNMQVPQVHEIAQGRIWTGIQGKERGLVDQLGGLADALAYAKQQAGLNPNATVTLEGGANPILKLLGLDDGASEQEIRAAFARYQAEQPSWYSLLKPAERQLVQSFYPLLQGEHVLTVLPFVIAAQ